MQLLAIQLIVYAGLILPRSSRAADEPFGRAEGQLIRLHSPGKRSAASAERRKTRVAVVMAGSARSFLFPLVHMSIKRNLIDALQADVDVFVRTTTA